MTDAPRSLKFNRQPAPVLAEHRPMFKIGQLLLVLSVSSRSGRSKLPRLHLFNWALKFPERTAALESAAKEKVLRVSAWGFDPVLAIAIRYAISEGLVRESHAGYEITELGESIAKEILSDANLLGTEKAALRLIGKGITEGMVEAVAKGWESA